MLRHAALGSLLALVLHACGDHDAIKPDLTNTFTGPGSLSADDYTPGYFRDSFRLLEGVRAEAPVPAAQHLLSELTTRAAEPGALPAILPREPLTVAFSGLRSADRSLRGVSLEYFENVLPQAIRTKLHLLTDED